MSAFSLSLGLATKACFPMFAAVEHYDLTDLGLTKPPPSALTSSDSSCDLVVLLYATPIMSQNGHRHARFGSVLSSLAVDVDAPLELNLAVGYIVTSMSSRLLAPVPLSCCSYARHHASAPSSPASVSPGALLIPSASNLPMHTLSTALPMPTALAGAVIQIPGQTY